MKHILLMLGCIAMFGASLMLIPTVAPVWAVLSGYFFLKFNINRHGYQQKKS